MKISTTAASKKLSLKRDSLRVLASRDLATAVGGVYPPTSYYCTMRGCK